jgi:hypothetical protein
MRRTPHATSRRPPIRRLIAVLIAVIAATAVAVPALAASSRKVDVPHKFRKLTPKVKEKSGLPVLLPQKIWAAGFGPGHVYPSGSATEHGYFLELDFAKGCQGANACFFSSFSGERGGKFSFKRKVKLSHGIVGRWQPIRCGASCAPAFIQWKEFGVLYEIEDKVVGKNEKRWMQKLANSAIRSGPR